MVYSSSCTEPHKSPGLQDLLFDAGGGPRAAPPLAAELVRGQGRAPTLRHADTEGSWRMYRYMHMDMYVQRYMCIYLYRYVHVYMYMYTYIQICATPLIDPLFSSFHQQEQANYSFKCCFVCYHYYLYEHQRLALVLPLLSQIHCHYRCPCHYEYQHHHILQTTNTATVTITGILILLLGSY